MVWLAGLPKKRKKSSLDSCWKILDVSFSCVNLQHKQDIAVRNRPTRRVNKKKNQVSSFERDRIIPYKVVVIRNETAFDVYKIKNLPTYNVFDLEISRFFFFFSFTSSFSPASPKKRKNEIYMCRASESSNNNSHKTFASDHDKVDDASAESELSLSSIMIAIVIPWIFLHINHININKKKTVRKFSLHPLALSKYI